MVKVKRKKYPLNPTLKLVNPEGRATSEFFRILTAIGELIENISILPGEIGEDELAEFAVSLSKLQDNAVGVGKLAAGSIWVSTLFVDEVIITSKVGAGQMTGGVSATQPADAPMNTAAVSANMNVAYGSARISFIASQSRPTSGSGNFGNYLLRILRNGTPIKVLSIYYDDNFAGVVGIVAIDSPGVGVHTYTIDTQLVSGTGNLHIVAGGELVVENFKR